jgi:hypothetical protein
MRTHFTLILVLLLLACPSLCRATADSCCADREVTSGTPDDDHAPAPSDEAANCICGGAVKAADNRVHGQRPECLSPPPDTTLSDRLWLHHSPLNLQQARGGSAPEQVGWRGSRRVHALFQHFRC